MIRDVDSLPPSHCDQRLEFEGFFSFPSHCRFRLYHSRDQVPLIVLTEVEAWLGGPRGHFAAAFQHPKWQPLTLEAFGALLDTGAAP